MNSPQTLARICAALAVFLAFACAAPEAGGNGDPSDGGGSSADGGGELPDGSTPDGGGTVDARGRAVGERCTRSPSDTAQGTCRADMLCSGPTWGGAKVCTATCSSDRDCGDGVQGPNICALMDSVAGFCAERCTPGGAACSRAGDVCVPHRTSGVCVPDCRSADQGCAPGDHCDPSSGACLPTACSSNADCGPNRCERGRCVQDCPDDSCGPGSVATQGSIFEPRSAPLAGTLRVLVTDATSAARPIAGATVEVAGGPSGVTGADGRVVLEGIAGTTATVTARKAGYQVRTLAPVNVADAEFVLPDLDPSGDPPPTPAAAHLAGKICGFPTDHRPLASGEHLAAKVLLSSRSPNVLPPFGQPHEEWVNSDCGSYRFTLTDGGGRYAVVAIAGIVGAANAFEPLEIGFARGVRVAAGDNRTGVDVHLDAKLDAPQGVQALGPTSTSPVHFQFFAYGDLGPDGWFAIPETLASTSPNATFHHLPAAGVEEYVLLAVASLTPPESLGPPYSLYWKRPVLLPGVDAVIGPMLGFPAIASPHRGQALGNEVSWSIGEGWEPALTQVRVSRVSGFDANTRWQGAYFGPASSADVPAGVPFGASGDQLAVDVVGSRWSWAEGVFDYTRSRNDGWEAVAEDTVTAIAP